METTHCHGHGFVVYADFHINIWRATVINQSVYSNVLFPGVKVNFKKESELNFGHYVEVYDNIDNSSKSRSICNITAGF